MVQPVQTRRGVTSEQDLRQLIDLSPHPSFLTDPAGQVLAINRPAQVLLEVVPGKQWALALDAGERTAIRQAWSALVSEGTPVERRVQVCRPDGLRWLWVALRPVASGRCFMGVCNDVTEEYRAGVELRARAEVLALSDRELQIGHWKVNAETEALTWSYEVHRIHGTDPRTFQPHLVDGIHAYHPEDRAMVAEKVERAIRHKEPYVFRARLRRPNGELRYVRSAGKVNPYDDRELIGVFQDVTELVELDQRLVQSEERYALAVAASRDGIWDWDIPTGSLWWSKRFMDLVGVREDNFVPSFETFYSLLHPDDREGTMACLNAHLEVQSPFDVEYRLFHSSGSWVWIRARGHASWDLEGQPLRMVGTVADISGEKEAEAELKEKTRELQQRNSELERFAGVASHDLREPLRKIRSFIDLVMEREELKDPRSFDYLERAAGSASRLHRMVGELLEITRVPSQARTREWVDLSELLATLVEQSMRPDRVEHTLEVADLPLVRASRVQMMQVLTNLVDNAVKYRAVERPLHLRVYGRQEAYGWAVHFEDNGIGFDDAYAKQIFGLFERLHGKSEYAGTGLGLALCARVMEEYGGSIHGSGTVGVGARFVLQFPPDMVRPPEASERESSNGKSIGP